MEKTNPAVNHENKMKNTITLQFSDDDDFRYFQKYLGLCKKEQGTVSGLYAGLGCSALRRSKTIDVDIVDWKLGAIKDE